MSLLSMITGLMMAVSPPDTDFTAYENEVTEDTRKVYSFTLPEVKPFDSRGQDAGSQTQVHVAPGGKAEIDAPAMLRVLLARHLEINALTEELDGFRVQVYAGNSMESANSVRGEVIKSFNDYPVYQLWSAPHFRVRVGDYLSRSDAMRDLNRLKVKFPGAYIVPDKVKTPKYKRIAPIVPGETPSGDDMVPGDE
jgi:hypothetical protein